MHTATSHATVTRHRLMLVSDLPADRQAFALGMVQWNLFPTGILLKQHRWFSKTRKGFDCLSGEGYTRLQELMQGGHACSAQRGIDVARNHWRDWADRAGRELLAPWTDVSLDEAVGMAHEAADLTALPQTVYRDESSGGWNHTNAFASRLSKAEVDVTVLPGRYFT